jgi:hypothetical protein
MPVMFQIANEFDNIKYYLFSQFAFNTTKIKKEICLNQLGDSHTATNGILFDDIMIILTANVY